jgi:phage/plasmid primase-like uncharacterized protein
MARKKRLFRAIVDANLPQLAAAAAAYYTFSDKPYATALAIDQITHTLVARSMAAVGWNFLLDWV